MNRPAVSPGMRKLLWFLGLWAAGVGAVAITGLAIRAVLL